MPPKFDPNEIKIGKCAIETNCFFSHSFVFSCIFVCVVYLRAVGATVGATSTLAPKIGPLGLVSRSMLSFLGYGLYSLPPHPWGLSSSPREILF